MTISRAPLFALIALTACGETMQLDPPGPDAGEEVDEPDAGDDPPVCGDGAPLDGVLVVTADDRFRVWFNGELIDDTAHSWEIAQSYQVDVLREGTNVIALEAANAFPWDGIDRGGVADLRVGPHTYVTDGSWKVASSGPAGWHQPGFDDWAWAAPFVIGAMGIGPWYDVFAAAAPGSTAQWIWSSNPGGLAVDKPDPDVTYARFTFALADGCDL